MSRLQNVKKAGYYPLPPEITELIASHVQPQPGVRMLDPCAGGGAAITRLANCIQGNPYAIEIHKERAESTQKMLAQFLDETEQNDNKTHVLNESYFNATVSSDGFGMLYENPPYLWLDEHLGRAEHTWLVHTRKWLQEFGLLVWVVPHHMLTRKKTVRYLTSWFNTIQVYRFPDPFYEQFNQVVVFGLRNKKSGIPTADKVNLLLEIGEKGEAWEVLKTGENEYKLPKKAIVPDSSFKFQGMFINPADALAEARKHGVVNSDSYQTHLHPTEIHSVLRPLTPMKIGHLVGTIAAGHLNNQILQEGNIRLLIKGQSHKKFVVTQTTEPRENGRAEVKRTTEQVDTRITTIDNEGKITQHEGAALHPFLEKWIGHLTAIIKDDYPPKYNFDFNGFGKTIKKLNPHRLIPLVGKPGLLPAQAHAVAAAATRLKTRREVIVVGEMGTGKTLIGPGIAAALHGSGKRMNHILVLCPPHLVNKWIREIKHVWPVAKTIKLNSISDVDRWMKADGIIFGILKETKSRSGSGWEHALDWCGSATFERTSPKGGIKPTRLSRFHLGTPASNGKPHIPAEKWNQYTNARALRCPDCGTRQYWRDTLLQPGDLKSNRVKCHKCKSPLYQDIRDKRGNNARYPLATYINRKYKRYVDLLIADECHQFKGTDSDRGYAFHRLCVAARKIVLLTGTIYGGKASTLFHLFHRAIPQMAEEYQKTEVKKWVAKYGILQSVETTTFSEEHSGSGNVKSRTTVKELPGGSPSMMYWLLNRGIFVSLRDMGFALPTYEEIPISVGMTPEMEAVYSSFANSLKNELRQRLIRKDKSLLGAYLQALLTWPDAPWRVRIVKDPKDPDRIIAAAQALEYGAPYPKEQAILDLIAEEHAAGRRVLLLCQQTGTLDITAEWVQMIENIGLKAAVLKVAPDRREAWIKKQVDNDVNVLITHPRKVETGLDLLDFPTIVWMGTEYSIYTVLQASRRSWRIGQTEPVKVYYYCYENTLQQDALMLIAAKAAATLRVNGDTIPDESLAELDDLSQTDIESALARLLTEAPDITEKMQRINNEYADVQQDIFAGHFAECTSKKEAKKLYRALALQYHPDVAESEMPDVESLADAFKKANEEFANDESYIGYEMEDMEPEPELEPEPEPEPEPDMPPIDFVPKVRQTRLVFGLTTGIPPKKKRRKKTEVTNTQLSLFG